MALKRFFEFPVNINLAAFAKKSKMRFINNRCVYFGVRFWAFKNRRTVKALEIGYSFMLNRLRFSGFYE